jgi:hypothetical protein
MLHKNDVNQNAQTLIKDCQTQMAKNEYRTSTLKGIRNLSRSDLDILVLYAETFLCNGDTTGLMKLRGNAADVWIAYGLPQ